MKQVSLHTVSEKFADHVGFYKSEEQYNNEKLIIADCYNLIVSNAECFGNGTEKMGEMGKLLTLIHNYQLNIDLFHEEANRE